MGNDFYIVEIDRAKYTKTAKAAIGILGEEGLSALNEQIQSYIDIGLKAVGRSRKECVVSTRGDDAIIFFDSAVLVHNFAKAVHDHTETINTTLDAEHRCWFRIGCGYGKDVKLKDNKLGADPPSYGRATANRLRKRAKPGEILIDSETYIDLPRELKGKYRTEEKVQGKDHDVEPFICHRWIVIPNVEHRLIAESKDIEKKKLENDLEICKKKLLAEPENLDFLTEKIDLATKLEKIEEVTSSVDKASLVAPNQHRFRVLEGDLFFDLKSYRKAIIAYSNALEVGLGSKDYKVWLKLARSYFLIEEHVNAVTYYKKALTLCRDSPDDYLICNEYALTLDKLNRHHESIQLYNSSLHLQTNYRFSSYARNRSYRKIYS